jgi:serine phosphatase RsbU (regulator of sigma subunit)
MFRSVKSQIVFATSLIIIVILGVTSFFVIDQKSREINQLIFTNAVNFSDLTHERIISDYENNYLQQAFANYQRELSDIKSMDPDVIGVAIFNYKGEKLYVDESIQEHHLKLTDEDLERIQAVYPSVKILKGGRVVYLEKRQGGGFRYADFNGKDVEPVKDTDQIVDVMYPFRDPNNALRGYVIHYHVSYDSLNARISATRNNILVLAGFGILIALFIGGIVAGQITSPIKTLTEGAQKLGSGDFATRIVVKSRTEIGRLADTFNQMAADLEKSTLELVEKEKMGRELELAGEIQRELLPTVLPKIRNLDVAASLVSAEEVGGDCYDFLKMDEDNMIFYIGDVTGHGVPAGLVSAINNALVPAFMQHYQTTQELIVHLNALLKMKMRPNVFMTMVMAHWHAAENRLGYTQAGHDPMLQYDAATGVVRELSTGGLALGMVPDVSKVVRTDYTDVAVGDVVVMYTDGIPEAWANEKEILGMDRFKEIVARHAAKSTAQEIHDGIIADVRAYMGDYPQADDITMIVAKRTI